jgi:hypothetical protein
MVQKDSDARPGARETRKAGDPPRRWGEESQIMSWTVEYDSELGIVAGRYVGQVTDDNFREATAKAIALAKANNTNRFLIDDSQYECGATVLGLYELPNLHEELEADRGLRGGLVLPSSGPEQLKDARFYETVCQNRGWNIRVFSKRERAIEWLTSK